MRGRAHEIQQRLQHSRQRLRERGFPADAIAFVHDHPRALDAVDAALHGRTCPPETLAAGPRFGLRDGYAAELVDGEVVVVRYGPEGECCGAEFGESREVVWRPDDEWTDTTSQGTASR